MWPRSRIDVKTLYLHATNLNIPQASYMFPRAPPSVVSEHKTPREDPEKQWVWSKNDTPSNPTKNTKSYIFLFLGFFLTMHTSIGRNLW